MLLTNIYVRLCRLLERLGVPLQGSLHYIGGSDTLPAPLTREEESRLLAALEGEEGRQEARSQLIEHNLRLVVYIARRFENTGVGIEDLISIGTIGLIKGISSFDPAKGARLATYAARCIENTILSQRPTIPPVLPNVVPWMKNGAYSAARRSAW